MDWLYITLVVIFLGTIIALAVRKTYKDRPHAQTGQSWKKGDSITTTPIDNPMDFRQDGSIHPGDPGWEIMKAAMEGKAVIGHQKPDGTWSIEPTSD
jgi:hypothetical protein